MPIVPDSIYPIKKVPDDIRECMGCHLKSMGRGDQSGWKGVDAGGGKINWYCEKTACQQERDNFIARRQAEMITEQEVAKRVAQNPAIKPVDDLDDAELADEEMRLKTRLLAIKMKIQSRGKSTTNNIVEKPVSEQTVPIVEQSVDEVEQNEVIPEQSMEGKEMIAEIPLSMDGMVVHQTFDGVRSLCGGDGPMYVVGEILPENCFPCVDCADLLDQDDSMLRDEEEQGSEGENKKTEEPESVVDLLKLPRFTPKLIEDIVENGYEGGQILIPPEAYPEIDLEKIEFDRIQRGITKMFAKANLEVDIIQRAKKGRQFIGLVFSLKAIAQEK